MYGAVVGSGGRVPLFDVQIFNGRLCVCGRVRSSTKGAQEANCVLLTVSLQASKRLMVYCRPYLLT